MTAPPPPAVDYHCEARYGGLFRGLQPAGQYLPEIGSTASSLFIIFVGLHMLLAWRMDAQMVTFIAACFVVNGWAALLSHASGMAEAAIIDRWSLLATSWAACAFMLDEIAEAIFVRPGVLSDAHGRAVEADTCCSPRVEWPAGRTLVRAAGWIICLSVTWLLIAQDAISHSQEKVVQWTAVPLAMSIVGGLVTMALRERIESSCSRADPCSSADWQWARRRFRLGMWVGLTGVLLESLGSAYCDQSDFWRAFPSHALWHVGMSWGLMQCMIYGALLRLDKLNVRAHITGHVFLPGGSVVVTSDEEGATYPCMRVAYAVYFAFFPAFDFVYDAGRHGPNAALELTGAANTIDGNCDGNDHSERDTNTVHAAMTDTFTPDRPGRSLSVAFGGCPSSAPAGTRMRVHPEGLGLHGSQPLHQSHSQVGGVRICRTGTPGGGRQSRIPLQTTPPTRPGVKHIV